MNKTKLLFVLLTGLLYGACSSDDDGQVAKDPLQESSKSTQDQTPQKMYPLFIEVAENPMVTDGEENGDKTRAAQTTTASLSTFYLNYKYGTYYPENDEAVASDKQTLNKVSNIWGGGNWPGPAVESNAEVTWYAYTDGAFHFTGGEPNKAYINFASDELSSGTKDVLVSTTADTWNNSNGNLNFTFDHACAAVRFKVKKSSNLETPTSYTLSVSSIVLKHVVKHGKYYYDTKDWTLTNGDNSDFTDYTLYSGDDMSLTSSYTYLNGSENDSYLFLIPQELVGNITTGTYVEIAWKSNYGSHANGTAKIPLTKTLLKGHRHDIKISIGKTTLTTHSGY